VVRVEVAGFGWSFILPGFGLLKEFRKPFLYKWNLKDKRFATFEKGIRIPLRPFCGVMGVAPASRKPMLVGPPGKHGGNVDIRHLTAGSKFEIPIWVDGALFSAGDVHAAMGDAEVCGTAIECAGTATLRLTLKEGGARSYPIFYTKSDEPPGAGYMGATGIGPDLMEATRESVRNMIALLKDKHGLTPEEAYTLCSVAADLRIHEIVDEPNWVVGTLIRKDIFQHRP
jgi:acetamidase/formamidase